MPSLVTNGWFSSLGSGADFPHAITYASNFIWVGCETNPGKLVQFNPLSPSVPSLTVTLPDDGAHKWVVQMKYIPAKGKIYALCADPYEVSSPTTLVELNPVTGAFTDVISDASYSAEQGSFTFDSTYVYILSWATNAIYRYRLSDWAFVSSLGTSLPFAHCIEYDSVTGNLFATAATSWVGFPMICQVAASSFTITQFGHWELDKIFSDDIAIANGYVWVGSETTGNLVKFLATDVSQTPTRIVTGIESVGGNHGIFHRNFGVYFDRGVLWTGWEGNPGIIGRVSPTTNAVELFELPDINQGNPNEFIRSTTNLYITGYTQPGWISQLTVTNYDGADTPSTILVGDTLSLTDDILQGDLEHPGVRIGDSLNLRDSVGTSRVQANPLSDTLVLVDTLGFVNGVVLAVSDALAFLDGTNGLATTFADSLPLSDSVTVALNLPALFNVQKLIGDQIRLLDNFNYTLPKSAVAVVDSLLLRDRVKVIRNSLRDDYLRRYLNDVIEIIPATQFVSAGPDQIFLPQGGSSMTFSDNVAITVT